MSDFDPFNMSTEQRREVAIRLLQHAMESGSVRRMEKLVTLINIIDHKISDIEDTFVMADKCADKNKIF